jgi:endonuclease/exonuclease/phosphatase family metal-dependent hydrolase
MLNYFMPWLMVVLVPGLLVAGLARRIRLVATLALPTILIGLNFAPLFLPRFNYALASNTTLKVMSYNVLYRNHDLAAIVSIIRQEQPDILLLQEVTPTIADTLQGLQPDDPANPLYFAYAPQISQAIVSRYPLTSLETAPTKGRTQKVRVHTPYGTINVWNLHLAVPAPWKRGLINRNLQNAHRQAGWGFGFTFPAHAPRLKGVPILTPIVRIDHIFHDSHFFTRDAYTLQTAGGSDHLPVAAELILIER